MGVIWQQQLKVTEQKLTTEHYTTTVELGSVALSVLLNLDMCSCYLRPSSKGVRPLPFLVWSASAWLSGHSPFPTQTYELVFVALFSVAIHLHTLYLYMINV